MSNVEVVDNPEITLILTFSGSTGRRDRSGAGRLSFLEGTRRRA